MATNKTTESLIFGGQTYSYKLPRDLTEEEQVRISSYTKTFPELEPLIQQRLNDKGADELMRFFDRLDTPENIIKSIKKVQSGEVSSERFYGDIAAGTQTGLAADQSLGGTLRAEATQRAPHLVKTFAKNSRDIMVNLKEDPVKFLKEIGWSMITSPIVIAAGGLETTGKLFSGDYATDPDWSWRPLTGTGEKGKGVGLAGALQFVPMLGAATRASRWARNLKGFSATTKAGKVMSGASIALGKAARFTPERAVGYKLSNTLADLPLAWRDALSTAGNLAEIDPLELVADLPFQLMLNAPQRIGLPTFARYIKKRQLRKQATQAATQAEAAAKDPTQVHRADITPENFDEEFSNLIDTITTMAEEKVGPKGVYTPYRDFLMNLGDQLTEMEMTPEGLTEARHLVDAAKEVIDELTTNVRSILENAEQHDQVQEMRRGQGWGEEEVKNGLSVVAATINQEIQRLTEAPFATKGTVTAEEAEGVKADNAKRLETLKDALGQISGFEPTLENLTLAERLMEFTIDPANVGYEGIGESITSVTEHLEELALGLLSNSMGQQAKSGEVLDDIFSDFPFEAYTDMSRFSNRPFRFITALDQMASEELGREATRAEKDAYTRRFAASLIKMAGALRNDGPTMTTLVNSVNIIREIIAGVFSTPERTQGLLETDVAYIPQGPAVVGKPYSGWNPPTEQEATQEVNEEDKDVEVEEEVEEKVEEEVEVEEKVEGDVEEPAPIHVSLDDILADDTVVADDTVEEVEEKEEVKPLTGKIAAEIDKFGGLDDMFSAAPSMADEELRSQTPLTDAQKEEKARQFALKIGVLLFKEKVNDFGEFLDSMVELLVKSPEDIRKLEIMKGPMVSTWGQLQGEAYGKGDTDFANSMTPLAEVAALVDKRMFDLTGEALEEGDEDESSDDAGPERTGAQGTRTGIQGDAEAGGGEATDGETVSGDRGETEGDPVIGDERVGEDIAVDPEPSPEEGPVEQPKQPIIQRIKDFFLTPVSQSDRRVQQELSEQKEHISYQAQDILTPDGEYAFANEDGTDAAHDHKAKLVTSSTLGMTVSPQITYIPEGLDTNVQVVTRDETGAIVKDAEGNPVSETKNIVRDGLLSKVQLEAIAVAGQTWLTRTYQGFRKAIMWGHGTGSGKGRMIAGAIVEAFSRVPSNGKRRALWITESKSLAETDAMRDWEALGQDPEMIFNFDKSKWDKKTANTTKRDEQGVTGNVVNFLPDEGVMTITYHSLGSGGGAISDILKNTNLSTEEMDRQIDEILQKKKGTQYHNLVTVLNWLTFGEKQRITSHKTMKDSHLKWKDFSGVIAFDEAHTMKKVGTGAGAGSNAMIALGLQHQTPESRIVYATATAASEVDNFRYASRLGLWGEGTEFDNADDFITHVGRTGVAGLEILTKDMKALGLYVAAQLSFEGVEVDPLHIELDDQEIERYNTFVKALDDGYKVLEQILADNRMNLSKNDITQMRSQWWGEHQRLVNSYQAGLVTSQMLDDFQNNYGSENYTPVFQMISTGETSFERSIDRLLSNPKYTDKNGNITIPQDENGNYILSEEMVNEIDITGKQDLIAQIDKMTDIRPWSVGPDGDKSISANRKDDLKADGQKYGAEIPAPIEDLVLIKARLMESLETVTLATMPLHSLIEHFGAENIAEATGRNRRLISRPKKGGAEGEREYIIERHGNKGKSSDILDFKNDDKEAIVFSIAGATGQSYHASNEYKNKRQRVHYVLQPGWEADKTMQGFGRTNRTDQASAPIYRILSTNLPSSKRFSSVIAKRLQMLGALSEGTQKAGAAEMFSGAESILLTQEGVQVLRNFIRDTWFRSTGTGWNPRSLANQEIINDYLINLQHEPEKTLVLSNPDGSLSKLQSLEVETGLDLTELAQIETDISLITQVYEAVAEQFDFANEAYNRMGLEWDIANQDEINSDPMTDPVYMPVLGGGTVDMSQWLNRMMTLPFGWQNSIFGLIAGRIQSEWDQALSLGIADTGIESVTAHKIKLNPKMEDVPIFTGTAAQTFAHQVDLELPQTETRLSGIVERLRNNLAEYRTFKGIFKDGDGQVMAAFASTVLEGEERKGKITAIYPSRKNDSALKVVGNNMSLFYLDGITQLISREEFLKNFVDGESVISPDWDGSPMMNTPFGQEGREGLQRGVEEWVNQLVDGYTKNAVGVPLPEGQTNKDAEGNPISLYKESRWYITGAHLPLWKKIMPKSTSRDKKNAPLPIIRRISLPFKDGTQERIAVEIASNKLFTTATAEVKAKAVMGAVTPKTKYMDKDAPHFEGVIDEATGIYHELTRWFDEASEKKVLVLTDGSVLVDYPYQSFDSESGQEATLHRIYLFSAKENPQVQNEINSSDNSFFVSEHAGLGFESEGRTDDFRKNVEWFKDKGFIIHAEEGQLVLPSSRHDAVKALANVLNEFYIDHGHIEGTVHKMFPASTLKASAYKPIYFDTLPSMETPPVGRVSEMMFDSIPQMLTSGFVVNDELTGERKVLFNAGETKVGYPGHERNLNVDDLFANEEDIKWIEEKQPNIAELLFFEEMWDDVPPSGGFRDLSSGDPVSGGYLNSGVQHVSVHFLGGKTGTHLAEYGYMVTVYRPLQKNPETGEEIAHSVQSVIVPAYVSKDGTPKFLEENMSEMENLLGSNRHSENQPTTILKRFSGNLNIHPTSRTSRRVMQFLNIAMLQEKKRNMEHRAGPFDPTRTKRVFDHGDTGHEKTVYATESVPENLFNMAGRFAKVLGFHFGTNKHLAPTNLKDTQKVLWEDEAGKHKTHREIRQRPQTASKILIYTDVDSGEAASSWVEVDSIKDGQGTKYRNSLNIRMPSTYTRASTYDHHPDHAEAKITVSPATAARFRLKAYGSYWNIFSPLRGEDVMGKFTPNLGNSRTDGSICFRTQTAEDSTIDEPQQVMTLAHEMGHAFHYTVLDSLNWQFQEPLYHLFRKLHAKIGKEKWTEEMLIYAASNPQYAKDFLEALKAYDLPPDSLTDPDKVRAALIAEGERGGEYAQYLLSHVELFANQIAKWALDVGALDKDFQKASNSIDPDKRPFLAILKEVFKDIIKSLKKLYNEVLIALKVRFQGDSRSEGLEYLTVKPMVSFAEWMDNWVTRVEGHRETKRKTAGDVKRFFTWKKDDYNTLRILPEDPILPDEVKDDPRGKIEDHQIPKSVFGENGDANVFPQGLEQIDVARAMARRNISPAPDSDPARAEEIESMAMGTGDFVNKARNVMGEAWKKGWLPIEQKTGAGDFFFTMAVQLRNRGYGWMVDLIEEVRDNSQRKWGEANIKMLKGEAELQGGFWKGWYRKFGVYNIKGVGVPKKNQYMKDVMPLIRKFMETGYERTYNKGTKHERQFDEEGNRLLHPVVVGIDLKTAWGTLATSEQRRPAKTEKEAYQLLLAHISHVAEGKEEALLAPVLDIVAAWKENREELANKILEISATNKDMGKLGEKVDPDEELAELLMSIALGPANGNNPPAKAQLANLLNSNFGVSITPELIIREATKDNLIKRGVLFLVQDVANQYAVAYDNGKVIIYDHKRMRDPVWLYDGNLKIKSEWSPHKADYLPHMFDLEKLGMDNPASAKWKASVKAFMDANPDKNWDEAMAAQKLSSYIVNSRSNKFGNLEFTREYNIPWYEEDFFKITSIYLSRAWRRAYEIEAFGQNNEIYEEMMLDFASGQTDTRSVSPSLFKLNRQHKATRKLRDAMGFNTPWAQSLRGLIDNAMPLAAEQERGSKLYSTFFNPETGEPYHLNKDEPQFQYMSLRDWETLEEAGILNANRDNAGNIQSYNAVPETAHVVNALFEITPEGIDNDSIARKWIDRQIGSVHSSSEERRLDDLYKELKTAAAWAFLSRAWTSNISQPANAVRWTGMRSFLEAVRDIFKEQDRDWAAATGALTSDIAAFYSGGVFSADVLLRRWTPFQFIEAKINRQISALAGRNYLVVALKKFQKNPDAKELRRFTELDLVRLSDEELGALGATATEKDIDRAKAEKTKELLFDAIGENGVTEEEINIAKSFASNVLPYVTKDADGKAVLTEEKDSNGNRIVKGDYTHLQKLSQIISRGALRISNKTQFKTEPIDLPPSYTASPLGKLMGQFTTFTIKQAQFTKDALWRDCKNFRNDPFGVLPPMLSFLVAAGGLGMVSNIIGSLFNADIDEAKKWIYESNEIQNLLAHWNRAAAFGAISYLLDVGNIPGAIGGFFSIRAFGLAERLYRYPQKAPRLIPVVGPAIQTTLDRGFKEGFWGGDEDYGTPAMNQVMGRRGRGGGRGRGRDTRR